MPNEIKPPLVHRLQSTTTSGSTSTRTPLMQRGSRTRSRGCTAPGATSVSRFDSSPTRRSATTSVRPTREGSKPRTSSTRCFPTAQALHTNRHRRFPTNPTPPSPFAGVALVATTGRHGSARSRRRAATERGFRLQAGSTPSRRPRRPSSIRPCSFRSPPGGLTPRSVSISCGAIATRPPSDSSGR